MPKLLLNGALLLLFLLMCRATAAEPELVIRFSTQAPPNGQQFQTMKRFKELVETESRGRIRVDIYDRGRLFEDGKVAAAVSDGKVEIGHVNLSRYAETILVADSYYLPFLFDDVAVERASRMPEGEVRKIIDDAILEHAGARVLWWIPEGSILLLSKGVSMANPEAMAGKTVRISGPTIAQTVRLCGGIPKDVAANQQPIAYATGVVDVGMTSITAVMARDLWKAMDTITRTGHAISNFVVVVNEKFWHSLREDQRALLEKVAQIADREAASNLIEFEDAAFKDLERKGVKLVSLTRRELRLWRICSSDVLTDFLRKAGASGQKLVEAYARLRQDSCCNPLQDREPDD
jgi:TRAP-type C4-dicarboxylate transport system substrate-binding protein